MMFILFLCALGSHELQVWGTGFILQILWSSDCIGCGDRNLSSSEAELSWSRQFVRASNIFVLPWRENDWGVVAAEETR